MSCRFGIRAPLHWLHKLGIDHPTDGVEEDWSECIFERVLRVECPQRLSAPRGLHPGGRHPSSIRRMDVVSRSQSGATFGFADQPTETGHDLLEPDFGIGSVASTPRVTTQRYRLQ